MFCDVKLSVPNDSAEASVLDVEASVEAPLLLVGLVAPFARPDWPLCTDCRRSCNAFASAFS